MLLASLVAKMARVAGNLAFKMENDDFFQVSEQMELDSRNLSVSHTAQILKNSLSPWKILLCSWAAPRVIFVGNDRPWFLGLSQCRSDNHIHLHHGLSHW